MCVSAGTLHASYPSGTVLLRRLAGTSPLKESLIPGAYKKLLKAYKEVEEKDGEILLEETEKKTGLCPVTSAEKEGVVWSKERWYPSIACFDPKGCAWDLRKNRGYFCEPVSRTEVRNYLGRLPVADAVKKAIRRCISIVSSSAFLEKILGEDCLLELIDRGNKGGNKEDREICIGYDIFSSACNMAKNRRKENTRGYGEKDINESYAVPKDLLGNSMDRLVVEMEIKQQKINWGAYGFCTTEAEFVVTLRLILNTRTEEIEKCELCDEFVVEQPVGYYEKPLILFEKK